MGDSQEKCPNQNFTILISNGPVIINLNAVCKYFLFFPLRYIQIRIVILKLAA